MAEGIEHTHCDGAPYLGMSVSLNPPTVVLRFGNHEPVIISDRGNITRLALDLCEACNMADRVLVENRATAINYDGMLSSKEIRENGKDNNPPR